MIIEILKASYQVVTVPEPLSFGMKVFMNWLMLIGKDKKAQDKELRKGIYSGKLHFVLHGKKLKGEFALVKTHGRGENAWLLFKVKDKYVSKEDITLKDKSVISKKTLAQWKN